MFPADTSSTVPWFQRKRFLILTWNGSLSSLIYIIQPKVPQRAQRERQKKRSNIYFDQP
jgi:hypothetical protein